MPGGKGACYRDYETGILVFSLTCFATFLQKVELKEGSETFKNWKSPSSQVYMQYFMFNLTNPSDVQNGSKPSVKQVGPYSYRFVIHVQ
jgi:hypothetical protein